MRCAAFLGSADIADNAMVMRFKLTVNPTRPSYMQREAVTRLIAAFKEAGCDQPPKTDPVAKLV